VGTLLELNPMSLSNNILDIIPKTVFIKKPFKHLNLKNKLYLIGKHEKYGYLNSIGSFPTNSTETDQIFIILNQLTPFDATLQFFIRYVHDMRSTSTISFGNTWVYQNTNFLRIIKLVPLHFIIGNYIGKVVSILNGNKKEIILEMNTDDTKLCIFKGLRVLISDRCDDKISNNAYTIQNIYSTLNGSENKEIPTIIPIKNTNILKYRIGLKLNDKNEFNNINIDMPVFLLKFFY
jgi:hypothetical protein